MHRHMGYSVLDKFGTGSRETALHVPVDQVRLSIEHPGPDRPSNRFIDQERRQPAAAM